MTGFLLLTFGVLAIYAGHRLLVWMERRGWIYYRRRRGTSAALGNALLQVQTIYQPSVKELLEARLEEPVEDAESGDPPDPGDPGPVAAATADAENRAAPQPGRSSADRRSTSR